MLTELRQMRTESVADDPDKDLVLGRLIDTFSAKMQWVFEEPTIDGDANSGDCYVEARTARTKTSNLSHKRRRPLRLAGSGSGVSRTPGHSTGLLSGAQTDCGPPLACRRFPRRVTA